MPRRSWSVTPTPSRHLHSCRTGALAGAVSQRAPHVEDAAARHAPAERSAHAGGGRVPAPRRQRFERLALAGKLMHELVRPGVKSLQCTLPRSRPSRVRGARGAGERSDGTRGADATAQVQAGAGTELRTIDVHGGRAADLELAAATATGNHLARWLTALPPNELDCVAYRRALALLARREGWSFASTTSAPSPPRAGASSRHSRERAPRRGNRAAQLPPREPAWCAHRPRRQGHLLRHRRHQSQVAQGHVPDARRHAGQRGGRRHAARARAPQGTLCNRLLAALTENEIGRAPTAAESCGLERRDHPVVHSDAEGRMVLADTLALARARSRACCSISRH